MSLISSQRNIGRAQRLQRFENAGADFARFGMAVDLLLGKDQLIIDPDVKDAAGAGDHVPAFDKNLNFALLENVVRQTDGNGCVVSSRAVFNFDVHQSLLHDCLSLTIFHDAYKHNLFGHKMQIRFLRIQYRKKDENIISFDGGKSFRIFSLRKQRMKTNRIQWLMVVLALAPIVLYAYLGQFTRLMSVDNCEVGAARDVGAWERHLKNYSVAGGRYSPYLLPLILAPLLDTHLTRVILTASIIVWLGGCYWLAFQGLGFLKIGHSRQAPALAIAGLTVAAAINAFFHYTLETFHHNAVFVTNVAPIVLFTVYMALAIWMAPRLRKNLWWALGLAASGLICFLIAGFAEAHVVFQLFLLAFGLLASFALLHNPLRNRYIVVFGVAGIASLVSLIIQLIGPGVAVRRAAELSARSINPSTINLSTVGPRTLYLGLKHIMDPEVFMGFAMLMGLGLLIALVKYRPAALSKTSKTFELASPALWLCLIFHLICLPLLWGHTSNPDAFDIPASDDGGMIILNILLIFSFLAMLWGRKRINSWLQKQEADLLFLGWLAAAACIFVLLFALTQPNSLYFHASLYLSTSALAFLGLLASLPASPKKRQFGLLAFGLYGLGWAFILTITFIWLNTGARVNNRVLVAGAYTLVFSGLIWGGCMGCLAKHFLRSRPAAVRFLKLVSLAAALILAARIALWQIAVIPDYQNNARAWDDNHQKILDAVQEGKDSVEISPVLYSSPQYPAGTCQKSYYRLGSLKLIVADE